MPLKKLRPSAGAGSLRRYERAVERINRYEPELEALTNDELHARAGELRDRLRAGLSVRDGRAECFALVREAAKRTLGDRHYDVQLLGGLVLADGRVAEMKTGEGKTLTATLPASLYGMLGQGAHVVTVNDYLAARDAEWMRPVYEMVGVSVGVLQQGQTPQSKRAAYLADVTYGTNHEFGFDYLRENMVKSMADRVGQRRHYALVDEVDNILIDEARTPLIIAGETAHNPALYAFFAGLVKSMTPGERPGQEKSSAVAHLARRHRSFIGDFDYEVHEKDKRVSVTELGIAKAEKALGIAHLYTAENGHLISALVQALRAKDLYFRDVDYAVIDGEVKIIDANTGRIAEGRRWTDGLHEAVQAKEGVIGEGGNVTIASVTYQNFFRSLYDVLSGMTGTALTEAAEFRGIYKLDSDAIPTHRPVVRIDQPDQMFATKTGKFTAAVAEIIARHEQGQPVLVGTTTVEDSERVSQLLNARGVAHQVLNAKPEQIAQEASIVAQAGRPGAVTIATNMAGRGTDIKLGGDAEKLAGEQLLAEGHEAAGAAERFAELLAECEQRAQSERQAATDAGGLLVLATNRHESRRIDLQLRGRAGRQGDPGETVFMVSAEDDLVRVFAGDKLHRILSALARVDTDGREMPISVKALAKQVEKAQRKVEETRFRERKQTLDYDDVLAQQRKVVYAYRDDILEGRDLTARIETAFGQVAARIVADAARSDHDEDFDCDALESRLEAVLHLSRWFADEDWLSESAQTLSSPQLTRTVAATALECLSRFRDALPAADADETYDFLTRHMLLSVIDACWQEHLEDMSYLREGIGLRGIAQVDPLVAYKNEGYALFGETVQRIWESFCQLLFHADVNVTPATDAPSDAEPAAV